ncbi:hypothetical protein HZH66_013028 [Vespula vulgaris]|uniref:Uncharacterized protein n=1 Tax=Vespula vulgaris TaxID=7454 RepID=A0A834J8K1_VESVU|nr:hypothetical protein HZH66_013028 [Vespula vulgaris]
MSEADGVDSGAICKRGFTHLQFAEKPEAPEAERHLGPFGGLNSSGVEVAPLLCFLDSSLVVKDRVPVSPWVSTCSNLHAVGPGSGSTCVSSKSYGRSFITVDKDEEDEFLSSHFQPLQYLSQRNPLLLNRPKVC